jgi:hypothetical protein
MINPKLLAWLDQDDARITSIVRRFGWYIQYVGGECMCPDCDSSAQSDEYRPSFAYTVGLFGLGHPELLVFGLEPESAAGVLNDLGGRIRAGAELMPGEVITFENWPHRIMVEQVPNPGEIVFSANRFYQRPAEASVPVLQLSYDDLAGRFPWEPDYTAPLMQPRPGTFLA